MKKIKKKTRNIILLICSIVALAFIFLDLLVRAHPDLIKDVPVPVVQGIFLILIIFWIIKIILSG
jgi:hypothetical protein